MTAKANADIKPTGMRQVDLVDLLYQIVAGLQGICQKLDDDGGVTDETYESLCVDALFNVIIEDSRGNRIDLSTTQSNTLPDTVIISPNGIGNIADLIYMIFDSIETLTEQLDDDATVNFTNYESLAYTAILALQGVTNSKGNELGAADTSKVIFMFNPQGENQAELVEFLYNCLSAIYTIVHGATGTSGLDVDTGVTDTDYESLWFTDWFDLTVENRKGDRIGN
jgi:hypothetical protein